MKITFLGTGPSQGLPIIGGTTAASLSHHPKDRRLRSSVLVELENKKIIIDCGPDFRQQMLQSGTTNLDAILFTHEHNDHINGLDDIRPIYFLKGQAIPVFCNKKVAEVIKKKYDYMFSSKPYPGVPEVKIQLINDKTFDVVGIKIQPIPLQHGSTTTIAYRIDDFLYIVDCNGIPLKAVEKMKGLKILVINALRHQKHHSHFNLEEALEAIEKIAPAKAYLTAIGPELEPHDILQKRLPNNVIVAYDGLTLELP